MILASVACTSFLVHKSNVNQQNQLNKQGITAYQQSLQSGGGSIEQQANQVIAGVTLQNKKYNKINADIVGNNIIIPVIVEIELAIIGEQNNNKNNMSQLTLLDNNNNKNKTKLINTTAGININDKDILIKPDGIYIRYQKQDQLENEVTAEIDK